MVHTAEVLKLKETKKSLDKGDYKIVVHLSGTNRARLETLSKSLLVNIQAKLSKPIKVDHFWSQEDAILGQNKNKDKSIRANEPVNLYLGPGMSDLDQSDLKAEGGRYLVGHLKLSKNEKAKKTEAYQITMPLLPRPKPKKDSPPKAEKDNSIETLEKEQRVTWVKAGHGGDEHFVKAKELYPTHVPLYHARLQFLTKDAKEGSPVVTEQVDQIVQEILTLVDIKNAVFESQRKGKLSADEGKIKDAAEEEKKAWILAKVSQIRSMASKMNNEEGSGEAGNKDSIFNTLKELQQVCDFTSESKDVQIVRMNVELGKALKLPGWELKNLNRLFDIGQSKEIVQRKGLVFSSLGWDFAAQYQDLVASENFPHAQMFV